MDRSISVVINPYFIWIMLASGNSHTHDGPYLVLQSWAQREKIEVFLLTWFQVSTLHYKFLDTIPFNNQKKWIANYKSVRTDKSWSMEFLSCNTKMKLWSKLTTLGFQSVSYIVYLSVSFWNQSIQIKYLSEQLFCHDE